MKKLATLALTLSASLVLVGCGDANEEAPPAPETQAPTTAAAGVAGGMDSATRTKCLQEAKRVEDISKRSRQDPAALQEINSVDGAFLERCRKEFEATEGKARFEAR